jgi:uncharacterized protein (TIGR00251 family)
LTAGWAPAPEGQILANPAHSAFGALLRPAANGVTLAVRAQPGAKKTAVTGLYGEGPAAQLKIAVHAPPIEGRANLALIAFLAESFSIPKSAVEPTTGESSRSKVFFLRGVTLGKAEAVLAEWLRAD